MRMELAGGGQAAIGYRIDPWGSKGPIHGSTNGSERRNSESEPIGDLESLNRGQFISRILYLDRIWAHASGVRRGKPIGTTAGEDRDGR